LLVVPRPVTGNPVNVFAFRFNFRWHFPHRRWWAVRYNQRGLGIEVHLLGKRLMQRTTCQHLHILLLVVSPTGNTFGFLIHTFGT
jgi:hypothetical protein